MARYKRPKTEKNVSFLFAVVGSGTFPLDMLRYDSCVPHEEHDSLVAADEHTMRRIVVLRSYSRSATMTPGRWRSFGWQVLDWSSDEGACGVDDRASAIRAKDLGMYL